MVLLVHAVAIADAIADAADEACVLCTTAASACNQFHLTAMQAAHSGGN